MLLASLWMAMAAQDVSGLKAGESAGPGPVGAALGSAECLRGRLLDATSAAPVAGADVELWTEGDGPPPVRVAQDKSRADGSFRLARGGVKNADKVLIHAPAYRSTCVAASDTTEILLLPLAKHLRLRALDLEGNPIVGARAESRQTCAHAPPAWVGVSNAAGLFDVSTFPPLDDEPDVFVSAKGYGCVLWQSPEQMLGPNGLELRLPKMRPFAFRLVDSRGNALANRRVFQGEEPNWSATSTDGDGRARFDSPSSVRDFMLSIEHEGASVFVTGGSAPGSVSPTFVFLASGEHGPDEPHDATLGIPVHVVDSAGHALDLRVSALNDKGSNLEFVHFLGKDWGRTTLIAGGAFSGWSETVRVLDTPVETTLSVTREPVLEIRLPEDQYWIVHVQAGDDSKTLEGPSPPIRQPVPAGKAIIVCAVGERETRVARLGHIDEDRSVDMTRTASLVLLPATSEAPGPRRWPTNEAGLFGHVRLASAQIEVGDGKDAFEFDAPAHANFEALLSAPKCVSRAIGPWTAAESNIALAHRCSLTVRGSLKAIYAGGEEGESISGGGFRIADLAPGPLIVDMVRSDGSPVEVSIVLADGEERELTLR